MHFDDRLDTVLRFRADGATTARIQFRQLLDLLGTLPAEARGENLDRAYDRLAELGSVIPPHERAKMLAEAGLRLRSPRLVAALAASEPQVAGAALAHAQLSDEQWVDMIPALPLSARGHLRHRRNLGKQAEALARQLGIGQAALPDPASALVGHDLDTPAESSGISAESPEATILPPVAAPTEPTSAPATADEGIAALLRRIEAYRRNRYPAAALAANDTVAPRLPLGEEDAAAASSIARFDFATDAEASIVWADPLVSTMVTGLRIGARDAASPAHSTSDVIDAVRRRQPLRAGMVTIAAAPAISGKWQIDAEPWFDPLSGRFAGYRGRMRRPAPPLVQGDAARTSRSDSVRQLLHELRTPVNAIQVGAEIIQQQLFGPTPHEYRAHAASIAGDAARILAAFDELERMAKLDSGAMEMQSGEADLAELASATITQLSSHTSQRGSGFAVQHDGAAMPVGLAPIEAERLLWRLLATLAGACAPGEQLSLRLRNKRGMARLDVALPQSLAKRSDEELFQAAAGSIPQAISAGVFGLGFALRLAAIEARSAGGILRRKGEGLRLELPGLTAEATHHSQAKQ